MRNSFVHVDGADFCRGCCWKAHNLFGGLLFLSIAWCSLLHLGEATGLLWATLPFIDDPLNRISPCRSL